MKNDVIRLLPDSVANQIAAGEVIQRPASVVKELVENAIDAGATDVKIIIRDAGRTLIQVVDNGCGMSETDARLAFERHSTSKITSASDLFSLHTMGFRGEALASIAAVAQVELRTMRAGDPVGTRLCISGSRVESQEPDGCPPGSNMMIKNLFFNVPARRKFLKKDAVELSNIMHEFERLALVNPQHELTLIHNDTVLHQLTPGSLKQRIGQLFGRSVEQQLIPVETSTSIVKISGFVGRPDGARRRNYLQYFFVNGRNMRHPYFHKAVMHCYEKLLGAELQPNYFINFEVDPASIDVNIHPTKNEIKFENEQSIWQILEATVRESLGKFNVAPSLDFTDDDIPDIPAFTPPADSAVVARPFISVDTSYNPFTASARQSAPSGGQLPSSRPSALNGRNASKVSFDDWDKLYSNWSGRVDPQPDAAPEYGALFPERPATDFDSAAADAASVLQFKGKYILSPARSGLLVIDQHRAHVRVLYERFFATLSSGSVPTQIVIPEVVSLEQSQEIYLDSIADTLESMGFDISPLGGGSWSINGVPAIASECNPAELLTDIIDSLRAADSDASADLVSKVALSMARSRAIRSGQDLTAPEMEKLMSDLFALSTPTYTPDGLLVLRIIDTDTITRAF